MVRGSQRGASGLTGIRGYVEDSGEGRWTVEESIRTAVPAPVIALSLMMRQRSRQDDSYAAKVNAALRQQFGGHAVQKAREAAEAGPTSGTGATS